MTKKKKHKIDTRTPKPDYDPAAGKGEIFICSEQEKIECCGICKFWFVSHLNDTKGICRRYPTRETVYKESDKWCGEYVQTKN